jgi:hypothetical protein
VREWIETHYTMVLFKCSWSPSMVREWIETSIAMFPSFEEHLNKYDVIYQK